MTLSVLYAILALALFAGVVCRLRHTDTSTRTSVRMAFVALGGAAFCAAVAALLWEPPTVADTALLLAMCAVQLVSSRLWTDGVPPPYERHEPSEMDLIEPPGGVMR